MADEVLAGRDSSVGDLSRPYTDDHVQTDGRGGFDTDYEDVEQVIPKAQEPNPDDKPEDEPTSKDADDVIGFDRGEPIYAAEPSTDEPPNAKEEDAGDVKPKGEVNDPPAKEEAAGDDKPKGDEDKDDKGGKKTASQRIQDLITKNKKLEGNLVERDKKDIATNARLTQLETILAGQKGANPNDKGQAEPGAEEQPSNELVDQIEWPEEYKLPVMEDFWNEETTAYDMDKFLEKRDGVMAKRNAAIAENQRVNTEATHSFEKAATTFTETETVFAETLGEAEVYKASSDAVIGTLQEVPSAVPLVMSVVMESEVGPQMIYELGTQLEDFRSVLASNNGQTVIKYLGALEASTKAKYAEKKGDPPKGKDPAKNDPPTKRVSAAPDVPPRAPEGGGGGQQKDPKDMTIDEYEKWRGLDKRGYD